MKQQVQKEIQDLTWLSWSKIRNSSGTAGSFLKAESRLNGLKTYYKLSNYDSVNGVVGHECINEIIADRLLTILGVDHLSYQLIHANIIVQDDPCTTWLCASEDFKQPGENKLALDAYFQAERLPGEKPLDFCIRNGWGDYIWQMLVVDFLILNRDRHGANIEVLRNSRKKTFRLAPLFDHGLSLVFNCLDEKDLTRVNVLEDKPVQCFVGSRSTWKNLELIPPAQFPKLQALKETDREILFSDLEMALPQAWQDKIWEMIWQRWCALEDFRNQR